MTDNKTQTVSAPTTAAEPEELAEYEVDGAAGPITVQLTAAEAKARGAKTLAAPSDKAVRPRDK